MVSISCRSENQEDYKTSDAYVNQEITNVKAFVDSLVIHGHKDPMNFIQSWPDVSENLGPRDLFKKYLAGNHYYSEHRKNYSAAMQYADSTLQIFEELPTESDYGIYYLYAILIKSDVLRHRGLYGTSVQYLLNGWELLDAQTAPCATYQFFGRLGTITFQQENYLASIDFYTRSWDTSSGCYSERDYSYSINKFQYLQNMGSNYSELQMPDSALYYYHQSLSVLKEDFQSMDLTRSETDFINLAEGVAVGNMAKEYALLGDGDQAEKLWKESIRVNMRPGFANEHAQLMRLQLAEYYIDENRLDAAKSELDLTEEWMEEIPTEEAVTRWHKVHWKWLDKTGTPKEAYSAYQEYIDLMERQNEARADLVALDLSGQIQYIEQNLQIRRLQGEKDVKNMYIGSLIMIALMIGVILFLMWQNWRESQKNVVYLQELNDTISIKNTQLQRTNKTISKIMSIISHDLRNPLVGVREVSSFMEDDEELDPKYRKWAHLISNTSRQSLKLMNEILDLDLRHISDSGADLIDLKKERLQIEGFLQECAEILQLKANEKHQKIKLHTNGKTNLLIDPDKMRRVFNNVIGNAIKFSPENSLIEIFAKKKDKSVEIAVKDSGIGIDEEQKEHIFKMYSEAARPGTNSEKSYGLGLAISKHIVEEHDGKIWFETIKTGGTVFVIELPLPDL